MDEQERNEARGLIAELRAMLKDGTQAVRDLRELGGRFEDRLKMPAPAPKKDDSGTQLKTLEKELRAVVKRLYRAEELPERLGTLATEVKALGKRLDQPSDVAQRLDALEAELEAISKVLTRLDQPSALPERLDALDGEVGMLTGKLKQVTALDARLDALETEVRTVQPDGRAERFTALEAQMHSAIQRAELRSTAAATALNTLRPEGQA